MRFVVYGAGAVGGVLGGHLARDKHEVLLVCRGDHAAAITEQNGLRMKSATGDYFAHLTATPTIATEHFKNDTCIFFVPKSNDTRSCLDTLAGCTPADTPLFCFQNGVANEAVIAEKFTDVYGGVCRMTCSFLQPGQVSFRKFGRLIIGKYPKGASAYAKKVGKMLGTAGFDVAISNSITSDKWLKLVTNLQSAYNAIVDERDHDSVEFIRLKVGVITEAKRVLKAAKIRTKSADGKDPSIDEMIDDLQKPHAPRPQSSVRVHNSTWQNLYLKRTDAENAYFHGPIIELASKHGIPVPNNAIALELVTQSHHDKSGPGHFRAADILEKIRARAEAESN